MKEVRLGGSELVAIVDDEDFERVSEYHWYPDYRKNGTIYVKGRVNGKNVRLHRFILSLPPGVGKVDHQDRDGLNNSRKNLLETTHAQNIRNGRVKINSASGYRGVTRDGDRWRAKLMLGIFDSKEEASKAYVKAFIAYFGVPPRYISR